MSPHLLKSLFFIFSILSSNFNAYFSLYRAMICYFHLNLISGIPRAGPIGVIFSMWVLKAKTHLSGNIVERTVNPRRGSCSFESGFPHSPLCQFPSKAHISRLEMSKIPSARAVNYLWRLNEKDRSGEHKEGLTVHLVSTLIDPLPSRQWALLHCQTVKLTPASKWTERGRMSLLQHYTLLYLS